MMASLPSVVFLVALLAEGVDRNFVDAVIVGPTAGSPSSRRAWIEIIYRDGGIIRWA